MKSFGGGLALGLLVGAVVVGVGFLLLYSPTSANVRIVEGVTTVVNQDGTAAGVAAEGADSGKSYVIAGAMWRNGGGSWHSSSPTCLEPLSSGDRVRMGVVDAKPTKDAPGRPVVVWLECLP